MFVFHWTDSTGYKRDSVSNDKSLIQSLYNTYGKPGSKIGSLCDLGNKKFTVERSSGKWQVTQLESPQQTIQR